MLLNLSVKNFAIIEDMEIDFNDKMTVLTGETGAGKSLIIDAISLLLGNRANKEMIRNNQNKSIIEGIFTYQNKNIDKELFKLGISSDETLIIKREIYENGKSTLRVNNNLISLVNFKTIANKLCDIHTQHDTHNLFDETTFISLIDKFDTSIEEDLINYISCLNKYKIALKNINNLKNTTNETNQKLELYKFHINEIETLNLTINEEEEIIEKINALKNFDLIDSSLRKTYELLNSIDNIYDSSRELNNIESFNDKYKKYTEEIESSYYDLEDIKNNIKDEIDSLDYDTYELNNLQERLNSISKIKRKFNMSIEDILEYLTDIKQQVESTTDYDNVYNNLLKILEDTYNNTLNIALKISEKRKLVSKQLEIAIIKELKDLELQKVNFEINFEVVKYDIFTNNFQIDGIDKVDFLINTNIGETLKSITKTASGGEMSRIMLAFKVVFNKSQKLSTIIFDEIDTGVSGMVAYKIANKMKELSENTQLLCITHLPQVAALSNNHLKISKYEKENRTYTKVLKLTLEEKINEIAKMLSSNNITKSSIENAKELMDL